jgi:NAD(P)-dependent dehydrogenase (short-subunit alcohol dehydrogenase family)
MPRPYATPSCRLDQDRPHSPPLESEAGEEIRRRTAAGRWGELQDVAAAALFLASSASDSVTGACPPVDGGYSIAERR